MPQTSLTGYVSLVGTSLVPTTVSAPDGTPIPIRGYAGGRLLHVCSGGFPGDDRPDYFYTALAGTGGALAALEGRTNKGDCILVYPGHAETLSAADYMSDTGAASGFSIVGLGFGSQRPTFTWSATGSTWLLDTAGVEIANCRLLLAAASGTPTVTVTTPMTISAASCRLAGNYINYGWDSNTGCGSTLGAIAATTSADDCEFLGNYMEHQDGANSLSVTALSLNGADRIRIYRNAIFGGTTATTVGVIHFLTTLSANVAIYNNYLENLKGSSTIALSSAIAGVTGVVANNQFRVNSGILAETQSSNLSCTFFNNYTADTVNLSGALDVAGGASS